MHALLVNALAFSAVLIAVPVAAQPSAAGPEPGAGRAATGTASGAPSRQMENSNAPGSNEVRPEQRGGPAECGPTKEDCAPATSGDGKETIRTDSQPLGSSVEAGSGPSVDASDYPTSVGSGAIGSGTTGSPTGSTQGPVVGTGR